MERGLSRNRYQTRYQRYPRGLAISSISLDLHIHSHYSIDCLTRPRAILRAAERKGLDIIAVTDHNTLGSFSPPPSSHLQVIPGCEYGTNLGDITGLFNTTYEPYKNAFKLIDHLKQEKALVILVHPFRGNRGGTRLLLDVAEQSDLIEVWNPRSSLELNRKAAKLAHDLEKPVIAGSDAHSLKEIGSSCTVLDSFRPSESLSEQLLTNPRQLVVSVTPPSQQRVSRIIRALREYDYVLASKLAFVHCTRLLMEYGPRQSPCRRRLEPGLNPRR